MEGHSQRNYGRKTYRNRFAVTVFVVVAVPILIVWTAQILTQSGPHSLRLAGLALVVSSAWLGWRTASRRVVVTVDGLSVRGFTGTQEFRWTDISRICSEVGSPSPIVARGWVVLHLTDGARVCPSSLRYGIPAKARAIAEELENARRSVT